MSTFYDTASLKLENCEDSQSAYMLWSGNVGWKGQEGKRVGVKWDRTNSNLICKWGFCVGEVVLWGGLLLFFSLTSTHCTIGAYFTRKD